MKSYDILSQKPANPILIGCEKNSMLKHDKHFKVTLIFKDIEKDVVKGLNEDC